jgi:hypothetical protein
MNVILSKVFIAKIATSHSDHELDKKIPFKNES